MSRPATGMSMMLSLSFRKPFASRLPIHRLSLITCFTRSRVPGVTSGRLFKTRKTVGIESQLSLQCLQLYQTSKMFDFFSENFQLFCNGIYLYYSRKHFICQGDCGGGSVSISKLRRCVCADEAASVQPCWNRASKTPPDLAGKPEGKNSMVGQKADASYGSRGVDRKTRPIGLKLDCLNPSRPG